MVIICYKNTTKKQYYLCILFDTINTTYYLRERINTFSLLRAGGTGLEEDTYDIGRQ